MKHLKITKKFTVEYVSVHMSSDSVINFGSLMGSGAGFLQMILKLVSKYLIRNRICTQITHQKYESHERQRKSDK